MVIGEGDDQQKDNKLTIAYNSLKMVLGETIIDLETRFLKIITEIKDLGKDLNQKKICLKVLRGILSSWEMKVTEMRDR